jgi:ketosteroid isomerase-like protein
MVDGRQSYVGREAVAEQTREFLAQWSEFRIEAQDFVAIGEAVLVTERQYGKGKGSGIEIDNTFFALWTFREGIVVRVRWGPDRASAIEATQPAPRP